MAEEDLGDVYTWMRSKGAIRWIMSRKRAGLFAFLVGAISFLIINGTSGNLLGTSVIADHRLAAEGRVITATVTVAGLQHYGCSYTYQVEGRTYTGTDTGCGGLKVGSPVQITYLPTNPEISMYGNPSTVFWEDLLFLYGAPLSLVVFAFFAWKSMAKYWEIRYSRDGRSAISGRFPATDSWTLHCSATEALRIGRQAIEGVGATDIVEPEGEDYVYGWVRTWTDKAHYQVLASVSQGPPAETILTCSVRPGASIAGSPSKAWKLLRRMTTEIDAKRSTLAGGA